MLYKFKSDATGDVFMTGDRGAQLLSIIGKEPTPQGIVPVAALPAAILALERAAAAEEAAAGERDLERVALRQRAWPLVEMFKRSQHAAVAVVWDV
jgi:Domain of unknown function (DUF1840)